MAVPVALGEVGIRLAWRRGMNGVKRLKKFRSELKRIGPNKFKWEMRLRVNVHAHNFKSGTAISDGHAPGATK